MKTSVVILDRGLVEAPLDVIARRLVRVELDVNATYGVCGIKCEIRAQTPGDEFADTRSKPVVREQDGQV